jgi:CheY-like chemotaxis protein/HPt (histidine-containing phosphotransfer) domain-containing protein/anti-sigma regulatory factor (Ser/Thr protein kinase)
VIGMTDLLLATPLTGEQRRYASIVRDSAHSLLAILNDVLDFSKIDAGKLVLEMVDFDLRTLVENSADLLLGRAREQQTEVLVWVDPCISPLLRGDPVRLRQVLLNLLSNAIKFTHGGEVVVRVGTEQGQDAQTKLRFSVQDTGIGISEEARKRLFQPFAQADESTTRKYGGTGLGLAISKRLVDIMGGEIAVESEEGRGSTFWFTVPLTPATSTTGMTVDAELRGLRALGDLRGRRVLIAGQRATSGQILQDYLKAWGIPADIVNTGAATLAALRNSVTVGDPYAVVLADEDLADMEVAMIGRAMERQPALVNTRLILLSSWSENTDAQVARVAGCSAHVLRPVKQLNLLSALTGVSLDVEVEHPATNVASAFAPDQLVLVVEDNDVNLEVVRLQLRQLGLETQAARNGREAVEAIVRGGAGGARPFAAVLMDCHMPEMDGFAATGAIRKAEGDGPRLPIIALTASAMQSDRELCLRSGMDDYLAKPVETEELQAMLTRWLPAATPGAEPGETASSVAAPVQAAPADAVSPEGPLDPRRIASLRRMAQVSDPDFLVRLIAGFCESAPTCFAEIEAAIDAGDGEKLRQAAHRLKGSAANFGARRLVARCAEIEAIGRGGTVEGASDLLAGARSEYEDVVRALVEETPRKIAEAA